MVLATRLFVYYDHRLEKRMGVSIHHGRSSERASKAGQDTSSNRRRFFRIDARLRAFARRLVGPDDPPIMRAAEQSVLLSERKEHASDRLAAIDRKLETLLAVAGRQVLEQDFPLRLTITEISGCGLRFVSDSEFSISETLEVVIVTSHHPLQLASGVGRLCRPLSELADKSLPTSWALDFTRMRPDSQDAIVRLVFQEQRQRISDARTEG
jgi:hypothetical protein